MENLTNSAEEVLIDSLSFKLPSSGQYVTDRRSCTFHTEGSNSYSASAGTKVIRFRLAGDGSWLDPSTFRIMFDVVNADTNPATKRLRPIGKAHAFFRRLRISVRGQIIEDIDNYNRVSDMFHILQTRHSRMNDMIEEFGYNGDIWALCYQASWNWDNLTNCDVSTSLRSIPANEILTATIRTARN